MILYEVSLSIEKAIYDDFYTWLQPHIREVLSSPGFEKATLLTPCEEDSATHEKKLTVLYYVQSQEALDHYFATRAIPLREDGLSRFGTQFHASRRILHCLKHY